MDKESITHLAGAILAGLVSSGQVIIRSQAGNLTREEVDRSVREGVDASIGLADALVKRVSERLYQSTEAPKATRATAETEPEEEVGEPVIHRPVVAKKKAPRKFSQE